MARSVLLTSTQARLAGCVGTLWCPAEVCQDQLRRPACSAFRSSYCRMTPQVKQPRHWFSARSLLPFTPCWPSICPSMSSRRCFLQLEGLLGLRRCSVQGAPSTFGTCSKATLCPGDSLWPLDSVTWSYRPGEDPTGFKLRRLAEFLGDFGACFSKMFLLHFIRNQFGAVFVEIALHELRQGLPSGQSTGLSWTWPCADTPCPV